MRFLIVSDIYISVISIITSAQNMRGLWLWCCKSRSEMILNTVKVQRIIHGSNTIITSSNQFNNSSSSHHKLRDCALTISTLFWLSHTQCLLVEVSVSVMVEQLVWVLWSRCEVVTSTQHTTTGWSKIWWASVKPAALYSWKCSNMQTQKKDV